MNELKPEDVITMLECPKCKERFGVQESWVGVITCPYCSEYVEGM